MSKDVLMLFCTDMVRAMIADRKHETRRLKAPSYGVGDIICVKETTAYSMDGRLAYMASINDNCHHLFKKIPSLFMRKADVRIRREVTAIEKQRLQDITEADAIAEGFNDVTEFRSLWDKLNGKKKGCAWKDNPEVYVTKFRKG